MPVLALAMGGVWKRAVRWRWRCINIFGRGKGEGACFLHVGMGGIWSKGDWIRVGTFFLPICVRHVCYSSVFIKETNLSCKNEIPEQKDPLIKSDL